MGSRDSAHSSTKRTARSGGVPANWSRGVTPADDATERRAALARAGEWLGTLPARYALEQEDAVRHVADRCGYSRAAVERAFRARFWNRSERQERIGLW